jgi:hypothetical protein
VFASFPEKPLPRCAITAKSIAHIAFGSPTDIQRCPRHVCFTPDEQTLFGGFCMSALGQNRTHAPQQTAPSGKF